MDALFVASYSSIYDVSGIKESIKFTTTWWLAVSPQLSNGLSNGKKCSNGCEVE